MVLFKTSATALDSASGFILLFETLGRYTQSTRKCQNKRVQKLAWAESKAKFSRFKKRLRTWNFWRTCNNEEVDCNSLQREGMCNLHWRDAKQVKLTAWLFLFCNCYWYCFIWPLNTRKHNPQSKQVQTWIMEVYSWKHPLCGQKYGEWKQGRINRHSVYCHLRALGVFGHCQDQWEE